MGTNLIDFAQLGQMLGMGKTTMHAALRAGELPPAVRIGRRKRWRIETVSKWLAEHESPASPDPVYCHRAIKASSSQKIKKVGRPTKKEQIEGRHD